jgi:protoporphyrinogen/coproporphyrinogen III oxidase
MELKYGGLARGALQSRKKIAASGKGVPGSRSAFLTPTSGLAELVEALLERLQAAGVDMRLNTSAESVSHQRGEWKVRLSTGESLPADQLILATPAFVSGRLLRQVDASLADELESIQYTSTATISLAYRQSDLPRPLDGYGYVIPRREGRRALACTWTSTKFPHRAPPGYALLRVFVGRAGQEADISWDEPALLEIARHELRQTLGIRAEPSLWRVYIWEQAMPQYNLGHPARLERIDAALGRLPGLHLAGNGYRGIGIPDCIHSGEIAAQKAVTAQGILAG